MDYLIKTKFTPSCREFLENEFLCERPSLNESMIFVHPDMMTLLVGIHVECKAFCMT